MYCVKCKKTTDTSNEQLLLNKFINNLPVEMHLPGHNFTGPGTKLNKRLNPDLTPKK